MNLKACFSKLNLQWKRLTIVLIVCVFLVAIIALSYYATSNNESKIPSSEPTLSPTPSTSFTFTPAPTATLSAAPTATLSLNISDVETKKPVRDVSVLIDGKAVGQTSQSGEIEVKNVEYGNHKIAIVLDEDQIAFEQEVNILENTILSISIDMPNPVFEVIVDVKVDYVNFRELGRININLTNTGQISSQNTTSLIFVYVEDNLDTPATITSLDFGNIEEGAAPVIRGIVGIESFVWPKVEYVLVVILDQWEYTPENNQMIIQSTVPGWFPAEAQKYIYLYLENHKEIEGTISNILLRR